MRCFLTAGRHKGGVLLLTVKTVMPTAGVALPFAGVGAASEGVRHLRADRAPSSAGVIRPSLDESAPDAEVTLVPAGTPWPGWLPTGVITLQGEDRSDHCCCTASAATTLRQCLNGLVSCISEQITVPRGVFIVSRVVLRQI